MANQQLRKVQRAHKSSRVTVSRAREAWLKVENKTPRSTNSKPRRVHRKQTRTSKASTTKSS